MESSRGVATERFKGARKREKAALVDRRPWLLSGEVMHCGDGWRHAYVKLSWLRFTPPLAFGRFLQRGEEVEPHARKNATSRQMALAVCVLKGRQDVLNLI